MPVLQCHSRNEDSSNILGYYGMVLCYYSTMTLACSGCARRAAARLQQPLQRRRRRWCHVGPGQHRTYIYIYTHICICSNVYGLAPPLSAHTLCRHPGGHRLAQQYMRLFVYTYMRIYVDMSEDTRMCICMNMYTYVCPHIQVYIHTYTHTYIHTYTHT